LLTVFAAADFHIGMKFARYEDSVRSSLAEARTKTLGSLIDRANAASCDLFVIAGDLFDRPNCGKREVLEAISCLERFEGALVALLPGNHDYYQGGADGIWDTLLRDAGDRVVLLTEARPYDLADFDLDAVLYPAPCTDKYSSSGADGWVEKAQKNPERLHHLGIAHGSIQGISPDFEGRYYPMTPAGLEAAGVDLWIVGHTHVPWSAGTIYIPGTPEPDGFDCSHGGSAWIIEIAGKSAVRAERIDTGYFRFMDRAVEIHGGESPAEKIAGLLPRERENLLLRLSVSGLISADNMDILNGYIETLQNELFYLRLETDALVREITRNEIVDTYPEGSFPRLLLDDIAEENDPVLLNLAWSLIREASQ